MKKKRDIQQILKRKEENGQYGSPQSHAMSEQPKLKKDDEKRSESFSSVFVALESGSASFCFTGLPDFQLKKA